MAQRSSAPTPVPVTTTAAASSDKLAYNLDATYVPDDKHVLEPGDRISFRVVEDRDPAVSLVVADSRELDVPYVGRVSVAKKTCKQIASELKVLLEREYYNRATVVLAVDMVNKIRGKVYVMGQVRQQGAVELQFNEILTAGKAILRAGGFGDFANKEKVKVIRAGANGEKKPPIEINMVNVFEKGKQDQDVVLEPDDYVVVPQRSIAY
jgi:protein involved in polysaccharide export with SLBB domain